jgi:hypothetical protein
VGNVESHCPEAGRIIAPNWDGWWYNQILAVSGNEAVAMDELGELLPTITCVGLLALFLVFEAVRH